MFLSAVYSNFFKNRIECFSNSMLHVLDQYWSINNSHTIQKQKHEIIKNNLNTRGVKGIKQLRYDLVSNFDKSLSNAIPIGCLSGYTPSSILCFCISIFKHTNL